MDKVGPRGLEILNSLVYGWLQGECPIPGNISYQEVCEWLVSVGADDPSIELDKHFREMLNSESIFGKEIHDPNPSSTN